MNITRPLDEQRSHGSSSPIQDYLLAYSLQLSEGVAVAQGRPPVAWLLTFSSGRRLSSLDGPWSRYAQSIPLDGDGDGDDRAAYRVPVIRQMAERLEVFYAGRLMTMRPPEPVQFFSFARMAAPAGRVLLCNDDEEENGGEGKEEEDTPPLSSSPLWLYSVFGYCLREYRVTLLLSEMQTSTEVAPRHDLFTLPS